MKDRPERSLRPAGSSTGPPPQPPKPWPKVGPPPQAQPPKPGPTSADLDTRVQELAREAAKSAHIPRTGFHWDHLAHLEKAIADAIRTALAEAEKLDA